MPKTFNCFAGRFSASDDSELWLSIGKERFALGMCGPTQSISRVTLRGEGSKHLPSLVTLDGSEPSTIECARCFAPLSSSEGITTPGLRIPGSIAKEESQGPLRLLEGYLGGEKSVSCCWVGKGRKSGLGLLCRVRDTWSVHNIPGIRTDAGKRKQI